MPIEFRCSQCGKRLRVPDNAAGRQAKCPECANVQGVPGPLPAAPAAPAGVETAPLGDSLWQEALPGPSFADAGNPYAAPQAAGMPFAAERRSSGPRLGPPWERDGASLPSFFATVRDFYLSPFRFFSQMRREGGPWSPLGFAAAGSLIGCLMFMSSWFAVTLLQPNGPLDEFPADPAEQAGYILGMLFAYCCCSAVASPLLVLCSMFCCSALVHATLLMLGAATFSFETTFRVVAYAVGCTMLISLVPLCGFYVSFLAQLAYVGIGLKLAHEISGGAAAAAVLLPTILCGGGFFALVVLAVIA